MFRDATRILFNLVFSEQKHRQANNSVIGWHVLRSFGWLIMSLHSMRLTNWKREQNVL